MPRQSPFRVHLSKDERQHLESIARQYTSPYCDVIRAKIILLASQGLCNDVIASRSPRHARSSVSGASASVWPAYPASRMNLEAGVRPAFPPVSPCR
jgi:hypothetical protein